MTHWFNFNLQPLSAFSNKEELTIDKLLVARVLVMCGPREKYTAAELDTLKQYLEKGGSVLVTVGEGGEGKHGTNINYLLEQFGMSVNNGMYCRCKLFKFDFWYVRRQTLNKRTLLASYDVSSLTDFLVLCFVF